MPASTGWCRSRPRKARNDLDSNRIRQGGSGRSPSNVRGKLLLRRLQYSPVVASIGRVTRLPDQWLQLLYLVAFSADQGAWRDGGALRPSNIGAPHYASAMPRELRWSGQNSSRELRMARRPTPHSQRYAITLT